ncbi:hypothetical protein [Rubritalea tangerina]|uniref:hypothetical protein n=1 Tax=Rubritalea tangerina TaxID=430798 RepID=UPI003615330D
MWFYGSHFGRVLARSAGGRIDLESSQGAGLVAGGTCFILDGEGEGFTLSEGHGVCGDDNGLAFAKQFWVTTKSISIGFVCIESIIGADDRIGVDVGNIDFFF